MAAPASTKAVVRRQKALRKTGRRRDHLGFARPFIGFSAYPGVTARDDGFATGA